MKPLNLMTRIALAAGVTLLAASAHALCVQTFNAYGAFYSGPARLLQGQWNESIATRTDLFMNQLKAEDCTLINFQEVLPGRQIDIVERKATGQYTALTPNRDIHNGLMSLLKGEVHEQSFTPFEHKSFGLPGIGNWSAIVKGYFVSNLRLDGLNEDVFSVNGHFAHGGNQQERLAQVMQIFEWRLKNQDQKMILNGDFNMDHDSLERSFLMSILGVHDMAEESFGGHYPAEYCTYCKSNPLSLESFTSSMKDHIWDYVYVSNVSSKATHLKATHAQVNITQASNGVYLSDHFGVRVEMDLRAGAPRPSRTQLEKRMDLLMGALDSTKIEFLKNSRKYDKLIKRISDLQSQIRNRKGDAYSYWMSYR